MQANVKWSQIGKNESVCAMRWVIVLVCEQGRTNQPQGFSNVGIMWLQLMTVFFYSHHLQVRQ